MNVCKESDVFKSSGQKICVNRHINLSTPVKLHTHEFIEMTLFTEGASTHTINGREFNVKRGDFLILNSNMAHSHFPEKSVSFYYIGVKKEYILSILATNAALSPFFFSFLFDEIDIDNDLNSPVLHFHGSDLVEVEHFCSVLYEESMQKNTAFEVILDSTFKALLVKILRNIKSDNTKVRISEIYKTFPKIVDYINSNLSKTLSITSIAKESLYSPTYFSRLFKEYYGQTVKEYITSKRIERATILLKTSSFTIDEIMAIVGYSNKNQFYKMFKSQTGKTPAEYRVI